MGSLLPDIWDFEIKPGSWKLTGGIFGSLSKIKTTVYIAGA
jgi:hypothetical protein